MEDKNVERKLIKNHWIEGIVFDEIVRIENTAKCNYVDDVCNFTQEVLPYFKKNNRELYDKLIELYKEYYEENFWD